MTAGCNITHHAHLIRFALSNSVYGQAALAKIYCTVPKLKQEMFRHRIWCKHLIWYLYSQAVLHSRKGVMIVLDNGSIKLIDLSQSIHNPTGSALLPQHAIHASIALGRERHLLFNEIFDIPVLQVCR